jgi:hypothetical protein
VVGIAPGAAKYQRSRRIPEFAAANDERICFVKAKNSTEPTDATPHGGANYQQVLIKEVVHHFKEN